MKEKEGTTGIDDKYAEMSEDEFIDDDNGFEPVSYFKLYRFASVKDKILFAVGISAAFIGGVLSPLVNNIFGQFVQTMLDGRTNNYSVGNLSKDGLESCFKDSKTCDSNTLNTRFTEKLRSIAITMTFVAGAQLFVGYLFCICLKTVAENQVYQTKKMYFKSLLRQNIGWYDVQRKSHSVSRISQNGLKIQKAMGEGVGLCICLLTSSVFALLNAFYHGWLLTCISLISMPLLALVTRSVISFQAKLSEAQEKAYATAGVVAEESLGNIRTVAAYGGEAKECQRYEKELMGAMEMGKASGAAAGLNNAVTWLIFYSSSACTIWIGTRFYLQEMEQQGWIWATGYNPENILIVYLSMVMACYEFGEGMSYFETFMEGRTAGAALHSLIDRVSEIDVFRDTGLKPSQPLKGDIIFQDVEFSYPSRPDYEVLKGLNMRIVAGQTVALVGHSGCGKSTCVQLLQMFYEATKGMISIDGHDIRELNVQWLRSQLGVVGQEPVLFNGTISENIRYGRADVSQTEIEAACKQAHAHGFILELSEGYNTVLGDRGALISGGQKQRIAIARALVRNPSILLLDEATSALDSESQSIVQAALDEAKKGRTTLIIAHRLSTIKDADLIVVVKDGQVLERGAHDELIARRGGYYDLYCHQNIQDCPVPNSINNDEDKYSKGFTPDEHSFQNHFVEETNEDMENNEDNDDEGSSIEIPPLLQILQMNYPEWPFLLFGTIMAFIQGCVQTVHGVLFGGVIAAWALNDLQESHLASNYYCMMFLALAVVAGGSAGLQNIAFSFSGEKLTYRLRSKLFRSMVFQDIGWFDNPSNHIGALSTRLAEDAAMVQGATGVRIGNLVQGSVTVILSVGVAMFYSFKLGLVGILFVIILNTLSYFEEEMSEENLEEEAAYAEERSKFVIQAVSQIRTVASLGMESRLLELYSDNLTLAKRANLKSLHFRGVILGLSQSFAWFAYVILAYYGSYLMQSEKNLSEADVLAVGQFIVFGTVVVAEALGNAPDYYKAKIAAGRIMKLLQFRPQMTRDVGIKTPSEKLEGKITFKNVEFSYPTRDSNLILHNLSFTVEPGQKVAIVGPSGCGKSTCMQLIQRLYDPSSGAVFLDDVDIKQIDVDSVRSTLGIVSQEPILFDRTLAENIAYGDNSREVSMYDIISAAKSANIHDFIASLSEGYSTRVGQLGSQLSGGQKQRVAIARALIRNPRILLLDEATSALDMESEKIVQDALDLVVKGRTSLTISHRMSAIKYADLIIVIGPDGRLEESGTHSDLISRRGLYYQLASDL